MRNQNAIPQVWTAVRATAHAISRRRFLGTLGAGSTVALFAPWGVSAFARASLRTLAALDAATAAQAGGVYTLPPLPYDYNALEPHIDEATMRLHHDKHHQAYVDKANGALEGTDFEGKPVEEVLASLSDLPDDKQTVFRNNGGGHANHSLFWESMSPDGGGEPSGDLADAINEAFGSFDSFKEQFEANGVGQFGSGSPWLGRHAGQLKPEET